MSYSVNEYVPDSLIIASSAPVVAKGIILAAGQGVLARGTLLGVVTATGLAVICDNTAHDGSQVPAYILGLQNQQIDSQQNTINTGIQGIATLNVPTLAYSSGTFNRLKIITLPGQPISGFEAQLRQVGIILSSSMSYEN